MKTKNTFYLINPDNREPNDFLTSFKGFCILICKCLKFSVMFDLSPNEICLTVTMSNQAVVLHLLNNLHLFHLQTLLVNTSGVYTVSYIRFS